MKVACITDTHFCFKKGDEVFLESQMRFMINQFIPYLKKHGIKHIFHLGDFFDNRIHIESRVLNRVIDLFENHLKDFEIHIIVGNHDSYFESAVDVNSVNALKAFSNVKTYSSIEEIDFYGTKILMCPWITNNNEFMNSVKDTDAKICMGHFEILNCPMFKGVNAEHGLISSIFLSKFRLTLSGHFHTRSSMKFNGNELVYISNAFQMTRSDLDDPRGFSILDLNTYKLKFIENTESMKFVKVQYPNVLEKENVYNNIVDVEIDQSQIHDELNIQAYIERLDSFNPAYPVNIKVINKIAIESKEELDISSTSDLIKEYLDNSDIDKNYLEKVKNVLSELLNECTTEI